MLAEVQASGRVTLARSIVKHSPLLSGLCVANGRRLNPEKHVLLRNRGGVKKSHMV
jgi:hypothetical protein